MMMSVTSSSSVMRGMRLPVSGCTSIEPSKPYSEKKRNKNNMLASYEGFSTVRKKSESSQAAINGSLQHIHAVDQSTSSQK